MKNVLYPVLLAFALVCGFTACGTPNYITAGIRTEVTSIERSADGTVRVTWRVTNPNVAAYVFARTTHKLSLNGTPVGTLTDNARLGVPPGKHEDRTSVLTLTPAGGAALDQAVAKGSAGYQLESMTYLLLEEDNLEKIPFTSSGSVAVTAK